MDRQGQRKSVGVCDNTSRMTSLNLIINHTYIWKNFISPSWELNLL